MVSHRNSPNQTFEGSKTLASKSSLGTDDSRCVTDSSSQGFVRAVHRPDEEATQTQRSGTERIDKKIIVEQELESLDIKNQRKKRIQIARSRTFSNGHLQSRMFIKRSVSPSGRVDALSIEIDFPIGQASSDQLEAKASKLIALQDTIAETYLRGKRQGDPSTVVLRKSENHQDAPDGENSVALNAWIKEIGTIQTSYGECQFARFDLENGKSAKLFGTLESIARRLRPLELESIQTGMKLDIPCRIKVKPKGRFLEIQSVYPAHK